MTLAVSGGASSGPRLRVNCTGQNLGAKIALKKLFVIV